MSGSRPICRAARVEDAEAIAGFQVALAKETESLALDSDTCRKGVGAVFADPGKGRYFVATVGRQVVASLLVTVEWSDWRNASVWWIQSVYVLPEHRGRKVFSGIYRFVKELAASDAAVGGLRLYVEKRNQAARKVYRAVGMTDDHYDLFEWMKRF